MANQQGSRAGGLSSYPIAYCLFAYCLSTVFHSFREDFLQKYRHY
ncbi:MULTISPECIES: hypothetical protein [unclassified Nostoc]|nr:MULTISPECIES: hypothetical protein [unclassified Nostoc]